MISQSNVHKGNKLESDCLPYCFSLSNDRCRIDFNTRRRHHGISGVHQHHHGSSDIHQRHSHPYDAERQWWLTFPVSRSGWREILHYGRSIGSHLNHTVLLLTSLSFIQCRTTGFCRSKDPLRFAACTAKRKKTHFQHCWKRSKFPSTISMQHGLLVVLRR